MSAPTTVPALGARFVEAVAAKDPERLRAVLHPQVDFRALTPNRFWVADRQQLRYRFRGRNADGPMVVEQQAYFAERDGGIGWMRVVCSGCRPPA